MTSSAGYYDLLLIYYGPEPRPLPPDLLMLCAEYAGLCARGSTRIFFWVYF